VRVAVNTHASDIVALVRSDFVTAHGPGRVSCAATDPRPARTRSR